MDYTDSYVFVWFMLAYLSHMCLIFFIYSAGITEGFSMCAGDFVEVYSEESQECKITSRINGIFTKQSRSQDDLKLPGPFDF
jgi:hypothetical protein